MYIHVYIYIYMCIHIYIYIYIEREREREGERYYNITCIPNYIHTYTHTQIMFPPGGWFRREPNGPLKIGAHRWSTANLYTYTPII